jgi:hypothetical protein
VGQQAVEITVFDFDAIVNGFTALIGPALGALWKVFVWQREQPLKSKLEAAQRLSKWHGEDADSSSIRSFGDQELLRLDFKSLTGIDRCDDHAALLRARTKLGGRPYDWQRLKAVAAYLELSGKEIVVRHLNGTDYAVAALSALLVLMCGVSGLFFFDGLQSIASSDKGTPVGKLIASLVLGSLVVAVLVIAWLFSVVLLNMFFAAPDIRKKLATAEQRVSLDD